MHAARTEYLTLLHVGGRIKADIDVGGVLPELHIATLTVTASKAGTYAYLCAVPGHAHKGMSGSFSCRTHAGY